MTERTQSMTSDNLQLDATAGPFLGPEGVWLER